MTSTPETPSPESRLTPGLQRYEALEARAPEGVREGTWYHLSAWLEVNVPQSELLELYLLLLEELWPLRQAADWSEGGMLAACLRDAGDVLWNALTGETMEICESRIAQMEQAEVEKAKETPCNAG